MILPHMLENLRRGMALSWVSWGRGRGCHWVSTCGRWCWYLWPHMLEYLGGSSIVAW